MMKNRERSTDTPQIVKVDIGGVLHSKRQEKGLTVKQVSEIIKLSQKVIEQLETERFDEIGTAVYVRGYLSLYAKYLGLEASNLIHLYNEQYPSESTVLKPMINQRGGAQQQVRRHSKVFSFSMALLVFSGLAYAYIQIEPLLSQDNDKEITTAKVDDKQALGNKSVTGKETVVSELLTQTNGTQQLADEALKSANRTVVSDEMLKSDNSTKLVLESTSDLLEGTNNALEKVTEEVVDPQIRVQLSFSKVCWIKITDASEKVILSNTYQMGKKVDVVGEFDYPLSVHTWRPNAIKGFTINDNPIQLTDYKVSDSKFIIKKP